MNLRNLGSSSAFWSIFLHVIVLCSIVLLQPPNTLVSALSNETDKFALLKFKESFDDSDGVLSSWNDSIHFCKWRGISCGRRHQRIVGLNLEGYKLRGIISPYIGNLSFLRFFNLGSNFFSGEIPSEVDRLFRLRRLNLSYNTLQGNIPLNLSYCSKLQVLTLERNNLTGTIPLELGSLMKLVVLVLDANNLTGGIPPSLGNISSLQELSLVSNNLAGIVPEDLGRLKSLTHIYISVLLLLFALAIFCWRRKLIRKLSPTLFTINFLSQVSYRSLYQATNGFSPSMLIGTGSFGSVYKGILDEEENIVAIKVLNLQQKGASKSFLIECNALRNIRHRNLVKILTCCSSMDYSGNEFKALIYQYMPNGSLERWLNPVTTDDNSSRSLSLIQRLNIAADVAHAICYLHHHCDQPIIHCDLKPSNVLLDDEMIAHVSDFGLARLISDDISSSASQTSTIGIKGTIGYAPPEYAMGGEPSRQGDVYSYGILILEMFTGRRPTDEMFKDSFNLHNFVKRALPNNVVQVVDPTLLPTEVMGTAKQSEDQERNFDNIQEIETDAEGDIKYINRDRIHISAKLHNCLISIFEIGLACSEDSPNKRMNMEDVLMKLQHIKMLK